MVSKEIRTTGFADETQRDIGTIIMERYDLATRKSIGGSNLILQDTHLELFSFNLRHYSELLRWPIIDGDPNSRSLGREIIILPQTGETLSCRKIIAGTSLEHPPRASIDTFLIHDTFGIMKLNTADTAGANLGYSIIRFSIK